MHNWVLWEHTLWNSGINQRLGDVRYGQHHFPLRSALTARRGEIISDVGGRSGAGMDYRPQLSVEKVAAS